MKINQALLFVVTVFCSTSMTAHAVHISRNVTGQVLLILNTMSVDFYFAWNNDIDLLHALRMHGAGAGQ